MTKHTLGGTTLRFTRMLGVAAALTMVLTPPALFGEETELVEKRIRVVDTDSHSDKFDKLEFSVEPSRDSFRVDQPIRFNVKGNRDFYLYVYNVTEDGDAILLLPSRTQGNKLKAGQSIQIPNNSKFVADRPGREHFVFFGSNHYIEIKEAIKRDIGDSSSTQSKGSQDFLVTKEKSLEGLFAEKIEEKAVRLQEVSPGRSSERGDEVRHEVTVKIRGGRED